MSGFLTAFECFLSSRHANLRRIAGRTRGEVSVDELASEAWLQAIEIGQKRDWPFDFRDEEAQDTLLAWLHNRFVKYADKAVRYAVKLDRDWDVEDGERTGVALAKLLTAPIGSDPKVRQQALEEAEELTAVVHRRYSEAAAYVLLLVRVDWDLADLAALLWVGVATMRQRLKPSGLLTRVQPSLFDGVEQIDPDFEPWRKRRRVLRALAGDPVPQATFGFVTQPA